MNSRTGDFLRKPSPYDDGWRREKSGEADSVYAMIRQPSARMRLHFAPVRAKVQRAIRSQPDRISLEEARIQVALHLKNKGASP